MSIQRAVANLTSSWRRRALHRQFRRAESTVGEVREIAPTGDDPALAEFDAAFRLRIAEKWNAPQHAAFLRNDLNHVRRYVLSLSWVPEGEGVLLDPASGAGHFVEILRRSRGYAVVTPERFNLEKDPAPFPDASFDGVLLMEVLEHFASDPMFALVEINRLLKPGGFLLLTTPNVASWAALHKLIAHESPYLFGIFTRQGDTDRHNREYSVAEVGRLMAAAGFRVDRLEGLGAYPVHDALPAIPGVPPADRGDTIFCLGRKAGPVVDRYPVWLYSSW
jgi:SAM-dependent methyltransferase